MNINNNNAAFQLKGSAFTLTVLQLLNTDLTLFSAQLANIVKQTPRFFQNTPVIIDLQKISQTDKLDFNHFLQLLKLHGLIPVGISNAVASLREAAIAAGLGILPNTKTEIPPKEAASKSSVPPTITSKVITQPVRSGQQVYANQSDLIVVGPVSAGAELIADGHIHVYGALRGRALAGATGNKQARIFCQSLDAELISIAGTYWINEDLSKLANKENVQIYVDDEHLRVDSW